MNSDEFKELQAQITALGVRFAKIEGQLSALETFTHKLDANARERIATTYKRVENLDQILSKVIGKTRDEFAELRTILFDHIRNVFQRIVDIHDIVEPIEDKIFPDAKKARKQIAAIVGKPRYDANKVWDKKKR